MNMSSLSLFNSFVNTSPRTNKSGIESSSSSMPSYFYFVWGQVNECHALVWSELEISQSQVSVDTTTHQVKCHTRRWNRTQTFNLLDELYTVFYCQIFILDQSRSIQFRLFDNVLLEHGGLPHVFPLDFHLLSVQCTPTQIPKSWWASTKTTFGNLSLPGFWPYKNFIITSAATCVIFLVLKSELIVSLLCVSQIFTAVRSWRDSFLFFETLRTTSSCFPRNITLSLSFRV